LLKRLDFGVGRTLYEIWALRKVKIPVMHIRYYRSLPRPNEQAGLMPFFKELGVPRAPVPTPEGSLRVLEMVQKTCQEMIKQWKAGERVIDSIEFMLDGIEAAARRDVLAWDSVLEGMKAIMVDLAQGQLDAKINNMHALIRRREDSDVALCIVVTHRWSIMLAGCSYAFRSARTTAQEKAYIDAGLRLTDSMKAVERQRGWSTRNTLELGDGRLSLIEYNLTPADQKLVNEKRLVFNNALRAFINAYDDIPRRELALDMALHVQDLGRRMEHGLLCLELHWCRRTLTYLNAFRTGGCSVDSTGAQ
ncbi:unnamed protein product, partial [Mesorhabditis spiculigera]